MEKVQQKNFGLAMGVSVYVAAKAGKDPANREAALDRLLGEIEAEQKAGKSIEEILKIVTGE